jgi:hypothetical protein
LLLPPKVPDATLATYASMPTKLFQVYELQICN